MTEQADEKQRKIIHAETMGNRWLAEGNFANELGNKAYAEKCYARGQWWLDRYNKLTGRTEA